MDGIGVLQRVIHDDENRRAVYATADGSHKMLLRLYAFDLRGSKPSGQPVEVLRIPEVVSAHVSDIESRFDDVATDWDLDLSDYSVDPRMHYTVIAPRHRIRTIPERFGPRGTSAHRLVVYEGSKRAMFLVNGAASRFELDIQPGYLRGESTEEDRLLGDCMTSATLTWTRSAGFAVQRGETCKGSRQGVAIADDDVQVRLMPALVVIGNQRTCQDEAQR